MLSKTTVVKTIERAGRVSSQPRREALTLMRLSRSHSPIDHVKQQMAAYVGQSHLEKAEMNRLNDDMLIYLDKVKILEDENKNLMDKIHETRMRWGYDTKDVRDKYEQHLFDVRTRIDDEANLKALADVRNKRSQFETNEFQHRAEDTNKQLESGQNKIKNMEREIAQLRDTKDTYKSLVTDQLLDIEKNKLARDETWTSLVELLDKLDDESYKRIAVEFNNQTLREHIDFIKKINEREMNEMSQLEDVLPSKDQTEFYRDQLKRVIANIRKDYEQLYLEQKREIEEWMRIKSDEFKMKAEDNQALNDLEMDIQLENIQTLRNEFDLNNQELDNLKAHNNQLNKRLQAGENVIENEKLSLNETLYAQERDKDKISDDLDNLLNEYNHLNANKRSLENEIQVYKNLLKTQVGNHDSHSKITASPAAVTHVTHVTHTQCHPPHEHIVHHPSHEHVVHITPHHVPRPDNTFEGQVVNKKVKKLAVGVSDSSPDGKNITIENVGPSSLFQDLSGWVIRRKVDSGSELIFIIPAGTTIQPNSELILWGNAYYQLKKNNDIVTDFENWGFGINTVTSLITPEGEEVSSFHQQFTFSDFY